MLKRRKEKTSYKEKAIEITNDLKQKITHNKKKQKKDHPFTSTQPAIKVQ